MSGCVCVCVRACVGEGDTAFSFKYWVSFISVIFNKSLLGIKSRVCLHGLSCTFIVSSFTSRPTECIIPSVHLRLAKLTITIFQFCEGPP